MSALEVNFDGLVGPSHNYAGLSYGNVASLSHAYGVSNPRAAALQGLAKMQTLTGLGIPQGVLPPQERPDVHTLRRLGFSGGDARVIETAARQAPALLQALSSASSMWTANAATVSPSADSADGRVHFTPANLTNKFHRSIEHPTTARVLHAIFADERHFAHHPALPPGEWFSDEGAANHTRLCRAYGEPGIELFVHGRHARAEDQPRPLRFPARQTLEASQAVARLHGLAPERTMFIQQNPAVIDQGVFHNDVIAVGNANVLLFHRHAFLDTYQVIHNIRQRFGDHELWFMEVHDEQVNVQEAVRTYLFNSQLVSLADGSMAIIAPEECRQNDRTRTCLEEIVAGPGPLKQMHYLDLRESMGNGGGPACLRLRVVLSEAERAAANPGVFLDPSLYQQLTAWVERHYRDRLNPEDLADPALLEESRAALDELTGLLGLGAVYPFQGV